MCISQKNKTILKCEHVYFKHRSSLYNLLLVFEICKLKWFLFHFYTYTYSFSFTLKFTQTFTRHSFLNTRADCCSWMNTDTKKMTAANNMTRSDEKGLKSILSLLRYCRAARKHTKRSFYCIIWIESESNKNRKVSTSCCVGVKRRRT